MEKEMFMISFSGGRSSAYMTDRLLKELPPDQVIVCFANTGKEEPETLDFVDACDRHWGGVVHWVEYDLQTKFREVNYLTASRHGEPFAALIAKRRYLPNLFTRFCTQDLKIRPIKQYMMSMGHRYWMNAVGIRFDEPRRWAKVKGIAEGERFEVWMPMIEWKIDKPKVLEFWKGMPFDLQLEHYQGNCDLCFLKGLKKIRRLITENPGKADWWIEQEALIGSSFRKRAPLAKIVELIRTTPTLFDYEEEDIPCICTID